MCAVLQNSWSPLSFFAAGGNRLIVNINDLRNRLPDRARALLDNSFDEMSAVQRALKEVVATIDPNYAKEKRKFILRSNTYKGCYNAYSEIVLR